MTIFITILCDRHFDPQLFPYTTAAAAIAHAKKITEEYLEDWDDSELRDREVGPYSEPVEGWLYYAIISTEGDCVWVEERELDNPNQE